MQNDEMRSRLALSLPILLAAAFGVVLLPALQAASTIPCVYWAAPVGESAAALKQAGITRLCVPPDSVDAWRQAGLDAVALDQSDLSAREPLETPGVNVQISRASATRSPWIDANGWRIERSPGARFRYDEIRAGRGALAAAEAFAYSADAVLQIDREDAQAVGAMQAFLATVPADRMAPVADFGVVDDGSPVLGEVLNLLTRRNLLFRLVSAPDPQLRMNVTLGTPEYPESDAADPSAFALKVRHQLTDAQRTLRIYGTEVVICRLTGTSERRKLELLNYGGRDITGIRLRVRGVYEASEVLMNGAGRAPLEDYAVADGATEFSIPRLTVYGIVELRGTK
jgi:hypothetical protein